MCNVVCKSTGDSDYEESKSSSYSSDDDIRYLEQYNTRKQQDPQNRKKRVSKGIFKFNEIDMWDEGDLDTEKKEMFKELAKLMVTITVSNVEPTTESLLFSKKKSVRNYNWDAEWGKKTKLTLKAMFQTQKATLSKLVDHTPTGGDNKVTTFDMAKLCKGDDKHRAPHDPEILQYLQDLIGSEDKRFSKSTSSAAGHAWYYDNLSHENQDHLSIHSESLENTHGLHLDLTSKDNCYVYIK
ncbi:hypothetical protein RFI_39493 [Reticulomyxa filosa]|uniref:Uncharacterized protein n=1 Tax=Reticulomyxa filosa TaxID=46433 RepID=X6LBC2_RETFI|nr:hypothetical protein RFI_39493 [Reticulomyxa filosa]|eukprot:ETN98029.1 hypothetical protein RFI_39493 [Reticulomyxa filosa]